LNVPKTGFPWSIPPDLARLTPSDRYPELDNNNYSLEDRKRTLRELASGTASKVPT
jgi:hypothetical protein